MSLLETFSQSIKNIMGSKMRTFLTMLGIIIGVTSVIVIVGLGNGMEAYMRAEFASLGTNSLQVAVTGRGTATPTCWTSSPRRCRHRASRLGAKS